MSGKSKAFSYYDNFVSEGFSARGLELIHTYKIMKSYKYNQR